LLPYSPLLSGAYTRDDVELPAEYRTVDNMRRLAALRDVARETGATPNGANGFCRVVLAGSVLVAAGGSALLGADPR
jgi:hypothetical protein